MTTQKIHHTSRNFWEVCIGNGPLPLTFWGYLIFGSVLWMMVFAIITYAFSGNTNPDSETVGGFLMLTVGICWFLWSFIFCYASVRAAFLQPKPGLKFMTCMAVLAIVLFLIGVMAFMIHLILYAH